MGDIPTGTDRRDMTGFAEALRPQLMVDRGREGPLAKGCMGDQQERETVWAARHGNAKAVAILGLMPGQLGNRLPQAVGRTFKVSCRSQPSLVPSLPVPAIPQTPMRHKRG